MEHACCLFDQLSELIKSNRKIEHSGAVLGLLHSIAQFLQRRLWPLQYTLEVASLCVKLCKNPPAVLDGGRDLILVAVVCLGYIGVGLLEDEVGSFDFCFVFFRGFFR